MKGILDSWADLTTAILLQATATLMKKGQVYKIHTNREGAVTKKVESKGQGTNFVSREGYWHSRRSFAFMCTEECHCSSFWFEILEDLHPDADLSEFR